MTGQEVLSLLEYMVRLWRTLQADHPAFQNEERPLRVGWAQTEQQIKDLARKISVVPYVNLDGRDGNEIHS